MIEYRYENGQYAAFDDGRRVARALINDDLNYVRDLHVAVGFRRRGIARGLLRFIMQHRDIRLNRGPSHLKSASALALSASMGDEIGPEIQA